MLDIGAQLLDVSGAKWFQAGSRPVYALSIDALCGTDIGVYASKSWAGAWGHLAQKHHAAQNGDGLGIEVV